MSDQPDEAIAHLCASLGIDEPPASLELALTHRSYAYEHGGIPPNERLEFLGDAVLGLHVTEHLYRAYPDLPEGRLAKLRSAVVNMRALADIARRLGDDGLGPLILLGRGEVVTGGADKDSILADCFEAVLGSIHLDLGPDVAAQVVRRLLIPEIDAAVQTGAGLDWKTHLQEQCAAGAHGLPVYRVEQTGPDHSKSFTATVVLGEREYGSGTGRSKKEAEQEAARQTSLMLSAPHPVTP
ncbi:ribonuclease III [Cumulibacter manganitolerans]|uniref:ribonuclease III n=1 Tax=Cumulibacter manganitolerans TaxID=1884992 RepID=UPI0012952A51|nr:ribonuclease III [Cumulibacter manganitolerans]